MTPPDADPAGRTRAEQIFKRAFEADPATRAGILDACCGDDRALRAEVESLLRYCDDSGNVLDRPQVLTLLDAAPAGPMAELPRRFGRYELLERIGAGGMGVVYRARQQRPDRIVALKLVRFAGADEGLARRFAHESELLGRLQHPGIAQVFEAGAEPTAAGQQPYFAMELVDGQTIVDWARDRQLDQRGRCALLAQVADAVQHAHQKGVMHRDLKPDNVLVDNEGRPRVLDFGVARTLDPEGSAAHTDPGRMVGTLAYMSPEQAAGDLDLDTRTDVYALGVMLFELLTGARPHELDGQSLASAVRTLTGTPARAARSVNPAVPLELEAVLARALAADREARYATAADLAGDLRRFLRHEPVTARPPTAWYLFRKFTARNRGLVASAAVVALTLVVAGVGLTVAWWRASVAEATAQRERSDALLAREQARREANKANAVRDFLADMFGSIDPLAAGSEVRVIDLLDAAAPRLDDSFGDHPEVLAELHQVLGDSYAGVAAFEQAARHLDAAEALAVELYGADSPEAAGVAIDQAALLRERGGYPAALERLAPALAVAERTPADVALRAGALSEQAHILARLDRHEEAQRVYRALLEEIQCDAPQAGVNRARTLSALASLYYHEGARPESLAIMEDARDLLLAEYGPDDTRLLTIENNLGSAYVQVGRTAEAEALLAGVHRRRAAQLGEDNPLTLHTLNNWAWALRRLGRIAEAAALNERGLELRRVQLGRDHPDTLRALNQLAQTRLSQRRYEEAEALFDEALAARAALLGPYHSDTLNSRAGRARLLALTGRHAEAAAELTALVEDARAHLGPEHKVTHGALHDAATALKRLGEYERAEALYLEALEVRTRLLGLDHQLTLTTAHNLGRLYQDTRRYDDAIELLRTAFDGRARLLPAEHPDVHNSRFPLALCHRERARGDDLEIAIALMTDGLAWRRARHGEDHLETFNAMHHLAECLRRTGRHAEAVTWLERALPGLRRHLPPEHWWVPANRLWLAESLLELGRYARAAEVARTARAELEHVEHRTYTPARADALLARIAAAADGHAELGVTETP